MAIQTGTNKNGTIVIKGSPLIKEGICGSDITPGQMVIFNASSQLIPQPTKGADARRSFARESDYGDISKPYKVGDTMQFAVFATGQEVACILKSNAGDIKIGQALQASTNGFVEVATTGAAVIGYAMEASKNNSDEQYIKMEVA